MMKRAVRWDFQQIMVANHMQYLDELETILRASEDERTQDVVRTMLLTENNLHEDEEMPGTQLEYIQEELGRILFDYGLDSALHTAPLLDLCEETIKDN